MNLRWQGRQEINKLTECLATVTDLVLGVKRQLRHCAVVAGHPEMRVITKAAVTLLPLEYRAIHPALKKARRLPWHAQGHDAAERRLPSNFRHGGHFIETFANITLIVGLGTGETGRMNSRTALQRIDDQAGIVSQARQTGKLRNSFRLFYGILGKCFAIFHHIRDPGELFESPYTDAT